MEELKDVSIHHTTIKLVTAIKSMKNYDAFLRTVQTLACRPNVDKNQLPISLEEEIRNSGLETEIRNMVFHLLRSSPSLEVKSSPLPSEPLAFLRRAGVQWDRRVRKSLNAMCIELEMSLQGLPRLPQDREEFLAKWEELSNYSIELDNYRPVYAPKDLLDVLLSLKGPPAKPAGDPDSVPKWEFSHITLPVKDLSQLRSHFGDFIRNDNYTILASMTHQCQRVLASKHAPLCQQLLKKGQTPAPYRGALWAYVLDCHGKHDTAELWNHLKKEVLSIDSIVDKLVFKDIQLTASNDDQYFVFEDVLYQIMLCFSRDTAIAELIHFETYPLKGKKYEGPPSDVVPFHGICMYAAPFCYLYDSPSHLYVNFRAFYVRYCHRLTIINTHPQGIVSLCLLFERLLLSHEPDLWSHFRELNIQPLRVVFKWIMRAFSGHLPPDELLILWDLILGYDSLEILSLLAVIILSFRKENLMQVSTLESIESILADLSTINVMPLLHMALTSDDEI